MGSVAANPLVVFKWSITCGTLCVAVLKHHTRACSCSSQLCLFLLSCSQTLPPCCWLCCSFTLADHLFEAVNCCFTPHTACSGVPSTPHCKAPATLHSNHTWCTMLTHTTFINMNLTAVTSSVHTHVCLNTFCGVTNHHQHHTASFLLCMSSTHQCMQMAVQCVVLVLFVVCVACWACSDEHLSHLPSCHATSHALCCVPIVCPNPRCPPNTVL